MDPAVIAGEPTDAEGRLSRLERLREICRIASSTRDLNQVLPSICDAVRHGLGFDRVSLYSIDPRAQRIIGPLAALTGEGDRCPAEPSVSISWRDLPRWASPVIEVALGHRPYWLRDEAANSGPSPSTGIEAGEPADGCAFPLAGAAAVIPLHGRGQIVGLLLVANPGHGRRLTPDDLEDLRPFAEQAGLAMADASFASESQRRVGFLSALLQISTSLTSHSELTDLLQNACDKLLEVADLELTAIFLASPGKSGADESGSADPQTLCLHTCAGMRPALPEFYAPFRVGERLAGRAARERLVIVNRNIQQDKSPAAALARRVGLRTVVSAPLVLRDELLGVLAAGTIHDMELTGEETDLIASVANQLSAAIGNVRLLEETRRRMEEHRRGRDELTVLYGISRAMVATIDLEERLRVIAAGLTEATGATRCAIFRRDPGAPLGGAGLLPWLSYGDTAEEKRRFQALDIPPADATRLLRALSPRKPPMLMRTSDQEPFSRIPWLRAWGVRSALWLPLAFQNRITGLAVVYQPGEERAFLPSQIELAAAVANQAAVAIRVSQAYEHERNIAETLQRSFMPTIAARLRNFDLGHTYHPALREAQVGGDFYDVFPVPNGQIALLMADVSGKGLPAAMQTAMVKYMLRGYAAEEPAPAAVLERMNRGLCAFLEPDLFVTAFYALLSPETGQLQYGNAGHDSPILALREHGYCTSLDVTGPPLGLDPAVTYFARTLCLTPGDLLLLYTDGITNAAHRMPGRTPAEGGCGRTDELFGRERLEELLAELASEKPGRIVSHIYRTVRAFAAGNLQDDCALLALKAKDVWK